MRTKTRLMHAGLLAAATACAAPAARAGDTAALAGHVSTWATSGVKVGEAEASQTVQLAVHMAARNAAGLKALADEVSKPNGEHYGEYLTPAAFAERFAPAASDVAAVQELLLRAGMKQVVVGPHGIFVTATATVAQLEKTFAVTQGMYSFRGVTLRANKEAPQIPSALAGKVLAVEGLDDTPSLKRPMRRSAVARAPKAPASAPAEAGGAAAAMTPLPVSASNPLSYCDGYFGDLEATLSTKPAPYDAKLPWAICGYTPNQVKEAYGFFKTKYDGTGVTVGIVDAYASPTLMYDLNRFSADQGLPLVDSTSFKEIIPAGIYDVPAAQVEDAYGWWGEESLDVAAVHGSAPGANIVYIGANDDGTALDVALMNAIYNRQADILTNSYGYDGEVGLPTSYVTAEDQAFMAAATMGITLLFSSGDDGDESQNNGIATGDFPATSPYVTAVGGTSLALKNAAGAKAEYGWGTYRDQLGAVTVDSGTSITTSGLATTTAFGVTFSDFGFYAGGGGGISLLEPQPAYQAGVVPTDLATTLNDASGAMVSLPNPQRVSPDVAMDADPYTGYLSGESFTIAGDNVDDAGCTPYGATVEYCETASGGTSLASPLMAGAFAVMNQKRLDKGEPLVGFVNPLLYSYKSGATLAGAGLNQVVPPAKPVAVLRGYASNPTEVRVVTVNSAPFLIDPTPYGLEVCSLPICEGLDDVFNYTSPGYNDVTGLGVPYLPKLIME